MANPSESKSLSLSEETSALKLEIDALNIPLGEFPASLFPILMRIFSTEAGVQNLTGRSLNRNELDSLHEVVNRFTSHTAQLPDQSR